MKFLPSLGPGAFRLFLASMVVVHHSFPVRMGAWAVYLFFTLSGYWIARMWFAKYSKSTNPLITFYVSRWWRLAPVFIVCSFLAVCLQLYLGNLSPPESWPLWIVRQIPIVGSASAGLILPPAWSLDVEMQFYLIAPLLLWVVWRMRLGIAWITFGLTLVLSTLHFVLRGHPEAPVFWPFASLFLLGILIDRSNWQPKLIHAILGLGLFAFLTTLFYALPGGLDGIWQRGADLPTVTDLQSMGAELWWLVGAIVCIPFVAWNVHQRSGHFDRWLGNLAFPLYLFHWMPRDVYYHFVNWNQPLGWNLALLVGNVLTAFGGAILILHFVDTPLDRLRGKWVNSRMPNQNP